MAKPIAQELADYLLSLRRGAWTRQYNRECRGAWTRQYNRECLLLWRDTYGEKVVQQVEAIVKAKWGE